MPSFYILIILVINQLEIGEKQFQFLALEGANIPLMHVSLCLLSHSVTIYCIIYFRNSAEIGFDFTTNYNIKISDIEKYNFYFHFMNYHNTFQNKKQMGSPR